MTKGTFIVAEGGEGAGKSTLIKAASLHFGDKIVVSREPGGSPFAEKIRELILSPDAKHADAKTMFCLFWAARADHMQNTIIPALQSGKHVLCDRFDSSSYAYQIFGQEDDGLKKLFFAIRDLYLGEFKPDLYLYLDVDIEKGLQRKAVQKEEILNHFDERNKRFHQRMRAGIKDFLGFVPHEIIDANPELSEVKELFLKRLSLQLR